MGKGHKKRIENKGRVANVLGDLKRSLEMNRQWDTTEAF